MDRTEFLKLVRDTGTQTQKVARRYCDGKPEDHEFDEDDLIRCSRMGDGAVKPHLNGGTLSSKPMTKRYGYSCYGEWNYKQ
jgi:hypothetical protein